MVYPTNVMIISTKLTGWSRLRQKSTHFLPDEADFCRSLQRYGQKNLRSMAKNGSFGASQRAT